VTQIVCAVLNIYLLALFVRIILSWFPINPGSVMAQVFSVLYTITEPVLGPVRRAIPPIGMGIDISPLILIIGIQVVGSIVLGCRIGL
jgi:YggT family protein